MRDDFCVFILTHGRPGRVTTYRNVRNRGYTGPIYLLVDDEDPTLEAYQDRYGDEVIVFSKDEIAREFDEGDNHDERRSVVYARNACAGIAKELGYRYFIQLDDDYDGFYYRAAGPDLDYGSYPVKRTIDDLFEAMVAFVENTPVKTVALSQGGDLIGGVTTIFPIRMRRKAMNSFVCDAEDPPVFKGKLNDDVNTYITEGRCGVVYGSTTQAHLTQPATQAHEGGITELYKMFGTYAKSFYTVMMAPSCAQIGVLGDHGAGVAHYRIHHTINWHRAVPKIIREEHKK